MILGLCFLYRFLRLWPPVSWNRKCLFFLRWYIEKFLAYWLEINQYKKVCQGFYSKLALSQGFLKLVSAIFNQIFIFSPNDSPLTMKYVFYFIWNALFVLEIFKFLWFFPFLSKLSRFKRTNGNGINDINLQM